MQLVLYKDSLPLSIDSVINIGEDVRARVTLDSNATVRFLWIDPDGNIARDVSVSSVDNVAEDTFTPSREGEWMVNVSVSDSTTNGRFTTARIAVIPEFADYYPLVLALAVSMIMLYSSKVVEKTKFKLGG